MMPGATTRPVASIRWASAAPSPGPASPGPARTQAMRSPVIPTSPGKEGRPVPSTIDPPEMMTSTITGGSSPGGRDARFAELLRHLGDRLAHDLENLVDLRLPDDQRRSEHDEVRSIAHEQTASLCRA